METIKTAFIGLGYRGMTLLKLVSRIDAFHVVAIADPDKNALANLQTDFDCTTTLPNIYTGNAECYIEMLKSEEIDLVFVASPWHLHHEHAVAVLNSNRHLALEVKGSLFEGEYQQLHEIAQKKQLKIYPLENTVFMRNIMAISQMIEEGIFGEIIFTQGAYRHDLREILLQKDDAAWRLQYYKTEFGDIYPTHSAAPVCRMLNINRGNKFKSLVSFATKPVGLKTKQIDLDKKHLSEEYALGDVVTTMILTESGAQITLFHDTTLPRPRSFSYEIQGTRAAWNYDLKSIYIEGKSRGEEWEDEEKYISQYEHAFWKRWGKDALIYDDHHKGMDYIMLMALSCDFVGADVYPISITDLAAWADISLLSKKSIQEKRIIDL